MPTVWTKTEQEQNRQSEPLCQVGMLSNDFKALVLQHNSRQRSGVSTTFCLPSLLVCAGSEQMHKLKAAFRVRRLSWRHSLQQCSCSQVSQHS